MFEIPKIVQELNKELCFKNVRTKLEFLRAFKALELFLESKDKEDGVHFRFGAKDSEIYYVYQTLRSIKVSKK